MNEFLEVNYEWEDVMDTVLKFVPVYGIFHFLKYIFQNIPKYPQNIPT